MGNTRDLFKKIRDAKGTFHAKMSTINDRNGMDLAEAEDIEKRWQEYIDELYKTDLNDPGNHDGVFTYLKPDILVILVREGKSPSHADTWTLGAGRKEHVASRVTVSLARTSWWPPTIHPG